MDFSFLLKAKAELPKGSVRGTHSLYTYFLASVGADGPLLPFCEADYLITHLL
jgi:hypothetical protein